MIAFLLTNISLKKFMTKYFIYAVYMLTIWCATAPNGQAAHYNDSDDEEGITQAAAVRSPVLHIPTAEEVKNFVTLKGGVTVGSSSKYNKATVSKELAEKGWSFVTIYQEGVDIYNWEALKIRDHKMLKVKTVELLGKEWEKHRMYPPTSYVNNPREPHVDTLSRKKIEVLKRDKNLTTIRVAFQFEGSDQCQEQPITALFECVLECQMPFDFGMDSPNPWYFDGHHFVRMAPGSFTSKHASFSIDNCQTGEFAVSFKREIPTSASIYEPQAIRKVPAAPAEQQ